MTELIQQVERRKYRNPPVVEIMADFQMSRGGSEKWDWSAAAAFLKEVVNPGEPVGRLQQVLVRNLASERTGKELGFHLSENTLRMRRYAAGRAHCVQIAPNRLIINCVKTSSQIPTYAVLEPLIHRCLLAYHETFQPGGVDSLSLGYIDDVVLPEAEAVELSRYFNLGVSFPDVFGGVQQFTVRGEWVEAPHTIRLEFKDIRPYTFRLDWQAARSFDEPVGLDAALPELQSCRDLLWSRFAASFTEAGHQLFSPE